MASFRGHLAFGGAVAVAGTAGVSAMTMVTGIGTLALLFILTIIGAFLPDIDSDSSVPFYIVYGMFTLTVTALVTRTVLLSFDDTATRVLVPLATLVVLWFIVGKVVQSWTHHRGIVHSVPAAAIAAMAMMAIATSIDFNPLEAVLLGSAVGAGFLSHLILDEIYSIVDFRGLPFIPNKAFGSALKLWSSGMASLLAYALVGVLLYHTYPLLQSVIESYF